MPLTTSFTIGTAADLENAITAISAGGADAAANTNYSFTFGASAITLASQLSAINLSGRVDPDHRRRRRHVERRQCGAGLVC